jgi:hypothetical protein
MIGAPSAGDATPFPRAASKEGKLLQFHASSRETTRPVPVTRFED